MSIFDDRVARGLGVTIRPTGGGTAFVPAPPPPFILLEGDQGEGCIILEGDQPGGLLQLNGE